MTDKRYGARLVRGDGLAAHTPRVHDRHRPNRGDVAVEGRGGA